MSTRERTRSLVIGLGNDDRGDDAAGLLVARLLSSAAGDGVDVVQLGDVSDALDLWTEYDTVVVVDAVRSGAEPASLHVLDLTDPQRSDSVVSATSTHALSLDAAVELARALGRLPRHLILVGVEASQFAAGSAPSAAVVAAVPLAASAVRAVLLARQEAC